MRKLFIVGTLIIFGSSEAAFATPSEKYHSETKITSDRDGSYKGSIKTEAIDQAGTATTTEVKREASADSDGDKTVETTSRTVQDPKGLMNKSKAEKETETTTKADGSYTTESETSSVNRSGTAKKVSVHEEHDVNRDGTSETSTTKRTVLDPKGLMNKQTSEIEKTVKKAADGSTTTTRKVNGQVVEQQ